MHFHKIFALLTVIAFAAAAVAQVPQSKWTLTAMETPKGMGQSVVVGHKPSTDLLHVSVSLPLRDPEGMQAFVDSVSNPTSPNYRHFLSPEEVGSRFGLSPDKVKQVLGYLTSRGFAIRRVSKGRLAIMADATVAQAEAAFHTTINEFSQLTDGQIRFSYTDIPSVPPSLAPLVTHIGGLENFTRPVPRGGPLTPSQLETLYSLAPVYSQTYQGQKRTVAISNYDGYRLSNVPLEYSQFSLPIPSVGVGNNITVVSIDGANGNSYGTVIGEGDLDMQCVLAMAPLCTLIIYDDASDAENANSDPVAVLTQEADDNKADLISESWGWSGDSSFYESCHTVHLQMSAEGITYLCACGDNGAPGVPESPYPDEDPEVLVVGGTSVTTDANGDRSSEVVWNDGIQQGSLEAGGGGWTPDSNSYNVLPSWQVGTGVPTNIPYRLDPDVSLDSDPNTGYEVFIAGLPSQIGGTSCASPTMAGSLADCEEDLIANGSLSANSQGNQRFGRINDLIYSFNGNASIFYDITQGNNGALPNGNQSNATVGWDTASGWGTMNFAGFVNALLKPLVLSSVTISPTSVVGGASATGTVTISAGAPTGGSNVALSSNTSSATVPSTVNVAVGATTATFTVSTSPVSATQTATIAATLGTVSLPATLTINPPTFTSLTTYPTTVPGGQNATGTVNLNGGAPTGGVVVNLSSSSASATVSATVTISAGSSSASFQIATTPVSSATTATITGTALGVTETATLTIQPPTLQSLSLSPTWVLGGASASGTVTLTGPAASAGFVVNLSSSSSNAKAPASVTISAGSTSANFNITTTAVSNNTAATITGTAGSSSQSATLYIDLVTLTSVTVSPNTVIGGNGASGTVTLSGSAGSGGVSVNLSSSVGSATIPSSVTVAAGASTATFVVTTSSVSSNTTATITGSTGGTSATTSLTIQAVTLAGFTVAPTSVPAGESAVGTVTIGGPAPNGGVTVALSSSTGATTPGSVTIPAGGGSATFTVLTSALASNGTANVVATLNGKSLSVSITITAAALTSVTITPDPLVGGNSAIGTVSLTGLAPSGGIAVSLKSSSTTATLPAGVTISSGASSASFAVTTKSVTAVVSATITAKSSVGTKTTILTIQPPAPSSLSLSTTELVGGSKVTVTGVVTLDGPAATAGERVVLKSSEPSVVSVPAEVEVFSRGTSAKFTVTHHQVATTQTVTITATYAGVEQSATLTLTPFEIVGVSLSPTTVNGAALIKGSVTLNAEPGTGSGPILVKLLSNSKAVALPVEAVVGEGLLTGTFTGRTKAVATSTTATVSAIHDLSSASATITVEPPVLKAVTVSPTSILGTSRVDATGIVTLSSAAPLGGLLVSLSSSDTAAVTVPGTVTVPSGATRATFKVTHTGVSAETSVTVTATLAGADMEAILSILP